MAFHAVRGPSVASVSRTGVVPTMKCPRMPPPRLDGARYSFIKGDIENVHKPLYAAVAAAALTYQRPTVGRWRSGCSQPTVSAEPTGQALSVLSLRCRLSSVGRSQASARKKARDRGLVAAVSHPRPTECAPTQLPVLWQKRNWLRSSIDSRGAAGRWLCRPSSPPSEANVQLSQCKE